MKDGFIMVSELKYVLITGYGWSGSSAVVDLLKGFDNFWGPDVEFRAIKDPYGLDDLCYNLLENWDVLNSDIALRNFIWHMKRLYRKNSLRSIIPGLNYRSFFGNNFMKQTNIFVEKLVDFEYRGHWWFIDFRKSKFEILQNKFSRRLLGTERKM